MVTWSRLEEKKTADLNAMLMNAPFDLGKWPSSSSIHYVDWDVNVLAYVGVI